MATKKEYTLADVAQHKKVTDCWIAVDGNVYDVTTFVDEHPGTYGRRRTQTTTPHTMHGLHSTTFARRTNSSLLACRRPRHSRGGGRKGIVVLAFHHPHGLNHFPRSRMLLTTLLALDTPQWYCFPMLY
jgi:predicted heme/steroid binding protein